MRTLRDPIDDELYSSRELAERMIAIAAPMLAGRKICCPCDDFRNSEIVKVLRERFDELRLNQLIATSYSPASLFTEEGGRVYRRTKSGESTLRRSVDCFGAEAASYYADSDVVITNPPFSRLREFVGKLTRIDVDYILIAPLTYLGTSQAAKLIMSRNMFASRENRQKLFFPPPRDGEESAERVHRHAKIMGITPSATAARRL